MTTVCAAPTRTRMHVLTQRHCEEHLRRSNPPFSYAARWIASRSLSSGAHSRDPLTRNDGATADVGAFAKILAELSAPGAVTRLHDGEMQIRNQLPVAAERNDMSKQEQAEPVAATNTVRLHRVLAAKPERVYRAFLDADALAKWLPPNGFTAKVHQMDAKVGGTFRMSFTNFTNGQSHSFGGEYLELVPHKLIRYTDRFDDPNLPGLIQVTVTLRDVSVGTEIDIVQEGLPTVIPLEACYLGWQQSLNNLALLTEPEING
jgi:uncharacterized protein YndB with AHSA1/START domain